MNAAARAVRLPEARTNLASTTLVPWRDVVAFALFTYAIAWALWSSLLPAIRDALSSGTTGSKADVAGVVTIGMLAPALAAVVMRVAISKEGLKGSPGPIRHKGRFYATAVVGAAAFVAAVVGTAVIGIGDFNLDGSPLKVGAALLFIGVPIGTALAFGEEYGWRGYLLPKLLPMGEFKASLVVGVIWAGWHVPVLLAGLNYPGESVPAVLGAFLLSGLVLSLIHTRLFVASGGSVLAVSVLHGSLNTFADRLTDTEHLTGNPLLVSAGGLIATGIMAVAAVALYAHRRRTRPFVEREMPLEEDDLWSVA